jgi:hypothetical protein
MNLPFNPLYFRSALLVAVDNYVSRALIDYGSGNGSSRILCVTPIARWQKYVESVLISAREFKSYDDYLSHVMDLGAGARKWVFIQEVLASLVRKHIQGKCGKCVPKDEVVAELTWQEDYPHAIGECTCEKVPGFVNEYESFCRAHKFNTVIRTHIMDAYSYDTLCIMCAWYRHVLLCVDELTKVALQQELQDTLSVYPDVMKDSKEYVVIENALRKSRPKK